MFGAQPFSLKKMFGVGAFACTSDVSCTVTNPVGKTPQGVVFAFTPNEVHLQLAGLAGHPANFVRRFAWSTQGGFAQAGVPDNAGHVGQFQSGSGLTLSAKSAFHTRKISELEDGNRKMNAPEGQNRACWRVRSREIS